jgi:hypothetical protein
MDGVPVLGRSSTLGVYHEETIHAIVNAARDVVTQTARMGKRGQTPKTGTAQRVLRIFGV